MISEILKYQGDDAPLDHQWFTKIYRRNSLIHTTLVSLTESTLLEGALYETISGFSPFFKRTSKY